MPSSGNKLLDGSFSSNQKQQQCGNILNVTNLSETIMQLDDEESNYKRLTLNNRSNRSSKLIYENSNNNNFNGHQSASMAIGAAPFFFSEQEILAPISYANRHSMRSNAVGKVQTIGEIMEPPPPSNRTVAISQINDSSASSFASTGDSGRDSIESPINNANNSTSKPFIIGMHGVSASSNVLLEQQNQMNQNAFFLNQNNYNSNGQPVLKLTQSSHLLDTRC
jgi:cytoskeletal protein RodZ